MGETVKLIIEIPKAEYELIVGDEACGLNPLTRAIAHGIPLDDVKEKIAKLRLVGYADSHGKREIASRAVMDVLDNIGKGE